MAEVKKPKLVASPEVAQLQQLLHDQPHNPMRPNVMEYHKEELTRLKEVINAPAYINANRGFAAQKAKRIEKILVSHAGCDPFAGIKSPVSTISLT